MVADRTYSRGLVTSSDRRASLLYFSAAVTTVGFIHGAADLSPLNAAALKRYVEALSEEHAAGIDRGSRRLSSAG